MINESVVILIPALNPEEVLVAYIRELIQHSAKEIIVVNDGSCESCREIFEEIERLPGCTVLYHNENKGKGRALKNAMKYYKENLLKKGYQGLITVDADGQHTTKDVKKVSDKMKEHPRAVILGEREFDCDVPFRSKFGNTCTAFIYRALYGVKLQDTQTGLRGIPNFCLDTILALKGERYEFEMNMLITCAKQKFPMESISIQTIYIDSNSGSHFRPFVDSVKIYWLLLNTFFKYSFVSISSFFLDILLFQLMVVLFKNIYPANYIIIGTIVARICSSLYNFFMNKKIVFLSNEKTGMTMIKYYVLCLAQGLVSALTVQGMFSLLHNSEIMIKMIIDTILFFTSYRIQKNIIFAKKCQD